MPCRGSKPLWRPGSGNKSDGHSRIRIRRIIAQLQIANYQIPSVHRQRHHDRVPRPSCGRSCYLDARGSHGGCGLNGHRRRSGICRLGGYCGDCHRCGIGRNRGRCVQSTRVNRSIRLPSCYRPGHGLTAPVVHGRRELEVRVRVRPGISGRILIKVAGPRSHSNRRLGRRRWASTIAALQPSAGYQHQKP